MVKRSTVRPPSMVQIKRTPCGTTISFAVPEIDYRNFANVADELDEVVRSPHPTSLVIDLTGVDHVDELGLAVLQSLQESIKEVGGRVTLVGPTDQIKRAASETQVARHADRYTLNRSSQWTQW